MQAMTVASVIESKLRADLGPQLLEVENESHKHSGPSLESHFKVTAVADVFASLSLVKRHQHIYKLLSDELAGSVHALALHLYTPAAWEARPQARPDFPQCRGGRK